VDSSGGNPFYWDFNGKCRIAVNFGSILFSASDPFDGIVNHILELDLFHTAGQQLAVYPGNIFRTFIAA
jgi:hypothetical protein